MSGLALYIYIYSDYIVVLNEHVKEESEESVRCKTPSFITLRRQIT